MTAAATAVPSRPGRPRSAEADAAIRQATIDLLAEEGYANLTMSGVASSAGVSTATLYRRWRSKVDLVVDVLSVESEERPLPDTGDLRGDCRAWLRQMVETMRETTSGPVMAGLVGEIGRNPELADAIRTTLIAPRRAAFIEMIERAERRGELRAGLDHELVIDLLSAPIYHRVLITGAPISRGLADKIVDLVLEGVTK
ncbi:MAG: TetR/AcrR family transcriptional regulator [Actinobacteria bacterium]|nr:TetR/AcrR family transcriptional regulator [Actinomycetota bacterium]MBV9664919.1 TetR/AcrR family transcriptional regulator [Actinomycetota bacterium]